MFLNVAYVRANEELFVGMITAVTALGLLPTCALVDRGPLQFNRALDTVGRCRFSIHDLSVLGADGQKPRTAHFNMPFELGIAVALSHQKKHDWFILGQDKDRIERALSDIKTVTIHQHDRSGPSVVAAVSRALYREGKNHPTLPQLLDTYEEVWLTWSRIRTREKYATAFLAPAFEALWTIAQDATGFYAGGYKPNASARPSARILTSSS